LLVKHDAPDYFAVAISHIVILRRPMIAPATFAIEPGMFGGETQGQKQKIYLRRLFAFGSLLRSWSRSL
jgi:hypothetical protein